MLPDPKIVTLVISAPVVVSQSARFGCCYNYNIVVATTKCESRHTNEVNAALQPGCATGTTVSTPTSRVSASNTNWVVQAQKQFSAALVPPVCVSALMP